MTYAQQSPKFKGLHDVLAEVFADPAVQLALRHDMVPADSQAGWNGCPALPAVVTGSLAVVRRLMGWSYRTLAEQVEMSFGWRWVCQIYAQPMSNFRTIRDREVLLSAKTIRLINTQVVLLGQALGVTAAQKLRLDSSVIETDIHYPTDSSLLADAARVFSRLIVQARQVIKRRAESEKRWFRDRHRQARRLAREITRLAGKKAKNTAKSSRKLYAQLIGLVEQLLEQVAYVQQRLASFRSQTVERIQEMFNHYTPLVKAVVAQARRRVLEGQPVPAPQKLVSLFEPHTSIIVRGKAAPKDTEFGHKVWYAEVEGGLISDYRLLAGNPPDAPQVIPSVGYHRHLFGQAPRELSGDRGLYSPENETVARRLGVRRVSLPQSGYKPTRRKRRERQAWFRAAQRFRNGIEGRISQLRRARTLHRCFNHGWAGLQRWLGWGIVANNIAIIVMRLNQWHTQLADLLC